MEALLSRDLVNTMGLSCVENLEREANAMMRDRTFIYKEHSSIVNAVAWSPDGKRIASSSFRDGTVQVWEAS